MIHVQIELSLNDKETIELEAIDDGKWIEITTEDGQKGRIRFEDLESPSLETPSNAVN